MTVSGTADEDSVAREVTGEVGDIFVANHRQFLAFLERRVGSRAIAEDILQEAFLRGTGRSAAAPIASSDEGSVMAWFYRTLRNAAIDYHRRTQTASRALAAFAAELERQAEPDPDARDAVCQCVNRLADTLKPEYAGALKRIEVDGLSVKDYASEMGISSSNAGVRIFRARQALRQQVTRSCGTCATHGCLDCTCGAGDTGRAAPAAPTPE